MASSSSTTCLVSTFILIQIPSAIHAAHIPASDPGYHSLGRAFEQSSQVNKYSYISPVGLKSLFVLERGLYNKLSRHAANASSIPQDLKLYLRDYEESTLKAIKHAGTKEDDESIGKLSWNPILAFRTVWRFVKHLRQWVHPAVTMPKHRRSKYKEISVLIAPQYNASDGPTLNDLTDAEIALLKLTDTLAMDIQHFARGNISGTDVGVGLTAAQCVGIGSVGLKNGLYVAGVEFMEAALERVQLDGDVSVGLSKIREHVKLAHNQHDAAFEEAVDWDVDLFTKPLKEVSARNDRKRIRDVWYTSNESEIYDVNLDEKYRYETVCQGKHRQAEMTNNSKLICWYEHQVHPTYRVGPLKSELLSLSPQVVKFHELISERAIISELRNISVFHETLVGHGNKISEKDFTARLGAFTILYQDQSSAARQIAGITGRTTGLVFNKNAELLQMTVYTPGAYVRCHPDLIGDEAETYGARIATFMFYLSDVEEGGGTGFCESGLVVKPEVGSAILWYDMLASGMKDEAANHCSCPVVFGEKWVVTAWISMGPQYHLQCHRDRSRRLEYLVNKKL